MSNKSPTKNRVRHLAGRDIHISYGVEAAPPPDNANGAVTCPQCHQRTWMHSRYCVHCRLDLWLWRASQVLASAVALAPLLGALMIRAVNRRSIDR